MSEFITPNAAVKVTGARLPEGHHAKKYAAGLPAWHPLRELLSGPSQWIGQIDVAYCLLRLFSVLYEDQLKSAEGQGLLKTATPPDIEAETRFFRDRIPNEALYVGHRYRLHRLHRQARSAIEAATAAYPKIHEAALRDFDHAFAKLVRAVRWS